MKIPDWKDKYLPRDILKKEISFMIYAYINAVMKHIPEKEIKGIYFKGSAQKKWDSPLDYVPELSDFDMHLLFNDDNAVDRYLGNPTQAMDILADAEDLFSQQVEKPLHIPRPQLMILNLLMKWKTYMSSPVNAVSVLYGRPYPLSDYSDTDRFREFDKGHLLEQEEYLDKFPLRIIDKPLQYLTGPMRDMAWRVSPVGPRVLILLGHEPEAAWSLNRTSAVSYFTEAGEQKLAEDYARFYLSGWDYFLSGYSDYMAAKDSLSAGLNVLSRSIQIANGL
jgi:hypothetical protein